MSEKTISILGRYEENEERSISGDKPQDWRFRKTDVSVEALKASMSDLLAGMNEVLDSLPAQLANYELDSMEINLEISSKGSVSLLGIGGELGGTGGITLHIKKKKAASQSNA